MKVVVLIPVFLVSFLFGQQVSNNAQNIDQKLELEGAYFYRALIKGEAPNSGAPVRKTAKGFGFGINYSLYLKKKTIFRSRSFDRVGYTYSRFGHTLYGKIW